MNSEVHVQWPSFFFLLIEREIKGLLTSLLREIKCFLVEREIKCCQTPESLKLHDFAVMFRDQNIRFGRDLLVHTTTS